MYIYTYICNKLGREDLCYKKTLTYIYRILYQMENGNGIVVKGTHIVGAGGTFS